MLELDSALAQHIVDRAMAILPHNINVMDAQGLIIGSGDPARLNTRHEGAQLVLANRRTVEIDAGSAACLRGVKAGVNLPLMHAEHLIGVLGITGDPDVIRPYAELVRMTAEMLVEQRQAQAERDWQRQQLQGWLRQLFDPAHPLASLQAEAERLGLRLSWPRQACLVELNAPSAMTAALAGRSDHLCAPLGARELLWSRPPVGAADDDAWLAQAGRKAWGVERLLVSDRLESLDELRQACLALRDLQAYARARRPESQRVALEEHRLPALLHAQRHHWLLRGWLEPLRRIREQDASGVLLQTLQAWCDHDGQVQRCAEALGIHRNTLRYRLERVAELSGLDLARLDQRVLLALRLGLLDTE